MATPKPRRYPKKLKKARVFATDGRRPVVVLRAQWEFASLATEAGLRASLEYGRAGSRKRSAGVVMVVKVDNNRVCTVE